jgi:hypothetical protein
LPTLTIIRGKDTRRPWWKNPWWPILLLFLLIVIGSIFGEIRKRRNTHVQLAALKKLNELDQAADRDRQHTAVQGPFRIHVPLGANGEGGVWLRGVWICGAE